MVNDELEIAVLFTYELNQLPCLTEWKLLSEGEYVLGIEPGISYPDDRVETKRMGALPTLGAGETRDVEIEVEILDGKEAIERAEKKICEI